MFAPGFSQFHSKRLLNAYTSSPNGIIMQPIAHQNINLNAPLEATFQILFSMRPSLNPRDISSELSWRMAQIWRHFRMRDQGRAR